MNASFCKACHLTLAPENSIGSKNGFDLRRCVSCATVTVHPFPSVEELIAFYQNYQGTTDYKKKRDRKISRAKARIRKVMGIAPGKKFLDVGCNYGFTVKAALDLGLDAFGIDIDATAVSASQKDFGGNKFRAVSVMDYAAEDHTADIVYTSEVIEHVPDPDAFVAAIAKILSPGGVLYLTTPDGGHWSLPRDFSKWGFVMPPEHITYFTQRGLRDILARHGLDVTKFFFNFKPGIRLIARKKAA
jgi:2-polyprenyl-3-methyl-5-hydroxy-6-metoxy-1,4-benzoquinol methylase